jgi:hypothetical protein
MIAEFAMGIAMLTRMEMTVSTIINSMRVNPLSREAVVRWRVENFFRILLSLH